MPRAVVPQGRAQMSFLGRTRSFASLEHVWVCCRTPCFSSSLACSLLQGVMGFRAPFHGFPPMSPEATDRSVIARSGVIVVRRADRAGFITDHDMVVDGGVPVRSNVIDF